MERLGVRLLEVAKAALSKWSESTMNSALVNALNPRDRHKSQLHQYLLLLEHLVVSGCLSRELVRQIGQVILQLAIDKAEEQPELTKVFAEAWVLMVAESGSPLRDMVVEAAFIQGDPLSLSRWTWLVEWLHRCGTNEDFAPCKVYGESLPGAEAADAYYALFLLRRGLLNGKGPCEGVDYHVDRCMANRDPAERANFEPIRHRNMRLDVERAGYEAANGCYLYLGHVLKYNRAVYVRVFGTRVFLLMPVGEESIAEGHVVKHYSQVYMCLIFLCALCQCGCLSRCPIYSCVGVSYFHTLSTGDSVLAGAAREHAVD